MKETIFSFRPSPSVYCVSITGSFCELQCGHCGGKYLSGMPSAQTHEALLHVFERAKDEGARSILVSGGFTLDGKLPISGFIEAIMEGKRRTGLKVEVHTGVLSELEIKELAGAGVDVLLLDVIGDQETITDYMGGTWSVGDYERMLKNAKTWIPIVAPHILIGVSNGTIKGEFNAVDMVSEGNVDSLVLLTLMGEYGTPSLGEIGRVMQYARSKISVDLTLGCMRSRGKERLALEKLAVDLGFDGIANPTKEALDYARSKGVSVLEVGECCAFIAKMSIRSKGKSCVGYPSC